MFIYLWTYVYFYGNLSLYAYVCIHMSVFICMKLSVFVLLSVSMSVYLWLCMSIPQFYSSHAAEDPESYEHIEGWWFGWWWMDVSGGESTDPLRLFGWWWSEVFNSPPPPLIPLLSHPVIRVTVRSRLAPIGRANNSFNNPGPCNISLLFGPRCHAKRPEMEKHLHCFEDEMTGWTLSGVVCVCVCLCVDRVSMGVFFFYMKDWP